MRPIFLSYKRVPWRAEVINLSSEICRRGLMTLVDVSDPEQIVGRNQLNEIRRIIQEECAGFVLYITENLPESSTVMNVEIPAAVEAYDRGNCDFVPYFRSVSPSDAKRLLSQHGPRIVALGGHVLSEGTAEIPADAVHASHVELAIILLRRQLRQNSSPGSPLVIWPKTRTTGSSYFNPDLTLDWVDNYIQTSLGRMAGETARALRDVIVAISESGLRTVRITGPSHLSSGLALGYALRRVTGFSVEVNHESSWWNADGDVEASDLDVIAEQLDSAAQDLALVVAVSRPEIADDAVRAASELHLPLAGFMVVKPRRGAGRDAVRSAAHARGIIDHIAAELMKVRTKWRARGVLHLFIAGPLSLAVLLGRALNAFGPLLAYETPDAGRTYLPTMSLHEG